MSVPRPISPWWALAPVALAAGWVAAGMPGLQRQESLLVEPTELAAPIASGERSPIEARPGTLHAASERPPAIVYSEWTTYDEALQQSRENGKPILLEFSAEWCEPCQVLKREVFENVAASTTVKSAAIPVALVDRVREDGSNPAGLDELEQRYDVQSFPTLVLFSPTSGRISRRVGYAGVSETLRWITDTSAQLH